MTFSTLLLATQNQGKIKELKSFLPPQVTLKSAADFSGQEPPEIGLTFRDNSALKARFWAEKTNLPSLADDSGLCITALDQAPGVFSKDFITHHGGILQTLDWLQKNKKIQAFPQAHFICVLSLVLPSGTIKFYEGRCDGRLVFPPRGQQGFGFDPIFEPLGCTLTFAEMSSDQKKQWSHRGKALRLFIKEEF